MLLLSLWKRWCEFYINLTVKVWSQIEDVNSILFVFIRKLFGHCLYRRILRYFADKPPKKRKRKDSEKFFYDSLQINSLNGQWLGQWQSSKNGEIWMDYLHPRFAGIWFSLCHVLTVLIGFLILFRVGMAQTSKSQV